MAQDPDNMNPEPSGLAHTRHAPGGRRSGKDAVILAAAMLVCALLACHGLGNHVLWEDEANTALFARNLLRFGSLTAWDGRNVIAYGMGSELDENLRNTNMPPLQYYVAAAGMTLFGEDAFGARILFVIAGVLALLPLSLWSRRMFGAGFPWFLPAILLAVSPAYLLLIRQCRYGALSVLFTTLFFAFWSLFGVRRRWQITAPLGAALALGLLWSSNYIHAAAVTAMIPCAFMSRRFRRRPQVVFAGSMCALSLVVGTWFLLRQANSATPPVFARLFNLREWGVQTWIYLRDLSVFELFSPLVLVAVWCAPLGRRSRRCRYVARTSRWLAAGAFVSLQVARLAGPFPLVLPVYFAPNPDHVVLHAAVRYLYHLFPICALLTAAALFLLWRSSRAAALAAGLALCLSNALYLPFLTDQSQVRSTLYQYVRENVEDHQSGYELLLAVLEDLPAGTTVAFRPSFVTLPALFYRPDLLYADQLTLGTDLGRALASRLPPYLYLEQSRPEVMIVLAADATLGLLERGQLFDTSRYRLVTTVPGYWADRTRPEIPYHRFAAPEHGPAVSHLNGILVYLRRPAAGD